MKTLTITLTGNCEECDSDVTLTLHDAKREPNRRVFVISCPHCNFHDVPLTVLSMVERAAPPEGREGP